MFSAFRQAGLLWPTLFAVPALIVLLTLGSWQWQRKAWKEGLIAQLAETAKAEPKALSELKLSGDLDDLRFRRVRVAGTFAGEGQALAEFHVWAPSPAGPGWRIVSPYQLNKPVKVGGTSRSWALVIRGRVPQADKPAARRSNEKATGARELVGRLRLPATNWATPTPNLAANEWHGLDLDGMLATLQTGRMKGPDWAQEQAAALPLFIEAETALGPPPAPQPDLKSVSLRNRHMEYAVTWWGLALTLIAVYAAFARGRLRGLGRTPAAQ